MPPHILGYQVAVEEPAGTGRGHGGRKAWQTETPAEPQSRSMAASFDMLRFHLCNNIIDLLKLNRLGKFFFGLIASSCDTFERYI
jgi:hypothetical protein